MKPPPFFHRSVKSPRGEKHGLKKVNGLYKLHWHSIYVIYYMGKDIILIVSHICRFQFQLTELNDIE